MKTFAFAGAAALAVIAVPVLAQQTGRPTPQPLTRAAFQQMVAGQFARVDTDRDGFVTKQEAEASRVAKRAERSARQAERRAERFARLDTNRDGQLNESEFNARAERNPARAERRKHRAARAPLARFGSRAIERADADKDGRVSLAEATARPLARFDRLDANKDGTLTPEERRPAKRWRHKSRADRG